MEAESDFKMLVHGPLYGPDFSPRALQKMTGLVFEEGHERGEVYQRKSQQFVWKSGRATLTTVANSLDERNWVAILKSVQGNWVATPEQIQKLAAVGRSLAVTYYHQTD
jgi:hypothetical protein